MFHHSWPQSQDLWNLYHKVTFDGQNRLIIINDGELDIDVKIDLYSDWKEWALQRDNLKWYPAMRSVGGDATVGGNFLGSTFFTINDWRILISDNTIFDGNLFSDDFASPFLTAADTKIARQQFSNLVDSVSIDTGDLITAGIATTTSINNQTTTLQTDTTNQTTTLTNAINSQTTTLQNDLASISGALPADVISQLNSTNYDGVPFGDIMNILLSMAQGRIVENGTGVFEFYAQDNSTILYTLTKSGNERTRS
jgi:hypothetical protein